MKKLRCLVLVSVMVCTLQSSLKILDTPDGKEHPEPCAPVCSGVSRADDPNNNWMYVGPGNTGPVWKRVDMSGCHFVSPPIATATTRDVFETYTDINEIY